MIIGFTGPMRAGKSTAAMHLVVSRGFVRLSFGSAVRRDCAAMLASVGVGEFRDIEEAMRTTASKEEYRGLLQWYGVFQRGRDPEHWVEPVRARIEMLMDRGLSVVIDDVRFNNEARMVRELGGHVICVESCRAILSEHASEQDWQTMAVDAVLWNDTTPQALHSLLDEVMDEWDDSRTSPPRSRS